MSEALEKLALTIERSGRRGFLGKLTAASVALVTSVLGFARPTEAVVGCGCCSLCRSPSTCSACWCTWVWQCRTGAGRLATCGECFHLNGTCNANCNDTVRCSFCRFES